MKKLSLIFALILLLTFVGSSYAKEDDNKSLGERISDRVSSSTANMFNKEDRLLKVRSDSNNITDLKKRADKEITRRLRYLNELLGKVDSIKKLPDQDKADLKTQIQAQIDGLTALQVKINADTDLETLKADVKLIVSDYYIYAFFRVKINLLFAADRLSATADRFSALSTKLETRIDEAEANGKDVGAMETSLADMNEKITDAKAQYTQAQAILKGLDAKGYPANRTSLTDAKAKIKLGSQELRAAYKDAIFIKQSLGDDIKLKEEKRDRMEKIPETPDDNN